MLITYFRTKKKLPRKCRKLNLTTSFHYSFIYVKIIKTKRNLVNVNFYIINLKDEEITKFKLKLIVYYLSLISQ